jgi:hypothetical protein
MEVEGGRWKVEGGGWRVDGGGWRVEGGSYSMAFKRKVVLIVHPSSLSSAAPEERYRAQPDNPI